MSIFYKVLNSVSFHHLHWNCSRMLILKLTELIKTMRCCKCSLSNRKQPDDLLSVCVCLWDVGCCHTCDSWAWKWGKILLKPRVGEALMFRAECVFKLSFNTPCLFPYREVLPLWPSRGRLRCTSNSSSTWGKPTARSSTSPSRRRPEEAGRSGGKLAGWTNHTHLCWRGEGREGTNRQTLSRKRWWNGLGISVTPYSPTPPPHASPLSPLLEPTFTQESPTTATTLCFYFDAFVRWRQKRHTHPLRTHINTLSQELQLCDCKVDVLLQSRK